MLPQFEHIQYIIFFCPRVTSDGVREFRVGCHSAAKSGSVVARSLTPGTTTLFAQHGHPFPFALLHIFADQIYPHFLHFQYACALLPRPTVVGSTPVLFSKSHSCISSGITVGRSFTPLTITFPEHNGHPFL